MFYLMHAVLLLLSGKISKSEYSGDDVFLTATAKLQDYLMNEREGKSNYRKTLPPSIQISVGLYFELLNLNDFDEIRGRLECNGMLRMNWSDKRLSWDPEKFNNTILIPFLSSEVWKPQISLLNTFSKFVIIKDKKEEFVVWYSSDGTANLLVAGVFDVTCDPNVKYFPFDSHECVLLFIPFESFVFPESASLLTMYIMDDSIIKDNFADREDDGKWIYRTMAPCTVKLPSRKLTAVAFPVVIHRRPTFAIINIILPVMLLGFLNLTVFFQPIQTGERISFSITVLLSFTVFMVYIGEIIPETSNPMPLLSYVLVFKLGCSTCIVIAVTLVMQCFHRKNRKVAPWVHVVVAMFSCKSRANDCTDKKQADDLSNIADGNAESHDDNDVIRGDTGELNEPNDDVGKLCSALNKLLFLFFFSLLLFESVFYIIAYIVMSADKISRDLESQTCTNGLE